MLNTIKYKIFFVFLFVVQIFVCIFAAETNKYKIMKEKIKDFGEFNGWRGCMGLYFNTKQLRPLKKYGITAATTLEEAYNIINE